MAAIGGFAIVAGYRRHRWSRVLFLMGCGLSLIITGAYWGDRLPSHSAEMAVTMLGSCLMVTAHLFNHTFCKECRRREPRQAHPNASPLTQENCPLTEKFSPFVR